MTDDPQSKIIVDEDWKNKVEAEREAQSADQPAATPPEAEKGEADDGPLPPPNLLFLASSLYMQALVALGIIANPMSGKSQVHMPQAKHAIDTLQVLQDKTQGNRTADETEGIEAMLHELRMTYVAVQK